MDKRKSWGKVFMVFVILAAVAAAACIVLYRNRTIRRNYTQSDEIFGNPLMGFAPCAWYEEVGEDVSLLYADVTWRELEPEKGKYDWEAIEEENQFARWRREGKHLILRFVCDIPDDEAHLDIPDWLYEETDGDTYDTSYGKGYAPDYGDEKLIRYHEQAVKAMGERWGGDTLISYIELGSLGHWGEWHVNYSQGIRRLPKEEVRFSYVKPWMEAFPNSILMMRRPFAPAAEYKMGLYNDMAGDADSTAVWLDWIENGGDFSQTQEEDALVAMPQFWKTAPSGGELTSGTDMEELAGSNLSETVRLLQKSHTTFLGPKIVPEEYAQGYRTLLGSMGYRLWISESTLKPVKNGALLTLVWENSGVAPFYKDWPVYITAEAGTQTYRTQMDVSLTGILPQMQVQSSVVLPKEIYRMVKKKEIKLTAEICDPMTGEAAVRFANKGNNDLKMTLFGMEK